MAWEVFRHWQAIETLALDGVVRGDDADNTCAKNIAVTTKKYLPSRASKA